MDPNNVRDPNSKSAGTLFVFTSYPAHLSPAKKDAKRLEKEAKLAAKTAKTPTTTKPKAAKEKPKDKEIEQPFVNTTPKGLKKGSF
jgi:valyl-tRNA synthetase